ncbi:glutamate--tRNA ligase 1 [Striga asiatica]|uniref:Glutamate--tRNA ligase 1 n=1 Tax=Striga asiatica TaxID=4170 RepID=A0A5A7Q1K8_STRAF|nr:glutamate--tRNA ligase 1 [Striga asiatica]
MPAIPTAGDNTSLVIRALALDSYSPSVDRYAYILSLLSTSSFERTELWTIPKEHEYMGVTAALPPASLSPWLSSDMAWTGLRHDSNGLSNGRIIPLHNTSKRDDKRKKRRRVRGVDFPYNSLTR